VRLQLKGGWSKCRSIPLKVNSFAAKRLVLGFVDQLVLGDPGHHRAQAGAGFFDGVRGGRFAGGFQLGLAGTVSPTAHREAETAKAHRG